MESIARFMIASTDLLAAEGRALKRQAVRIFLAAGLGIVALAMLIGGLVFILLGLFGLVANVVGAPWAALIFGVVALAAAAGGLLAAKKTL